MGGSVVPEQVAEFYMASRMPNQVAEKLNQVVNNMMTTSAEIPHTKQTKTQAFVKMTDRMFKLFIQK